MVPTRRFGHVVQSISRVRLFVTSWTAARQASLSFTVSLSLLKPMPIESVMPSNHLILCRPLLLLPSIFPSITVSSKESAVRIRWPKYWSFSFSTSPFVKHCRRQFATSTRGLLPGTPYKVCDCHSIHPKEMGPG